MTAHHDTFRDQLAIAYPNFGYALWEPDPGERYPAVEVGDVGFIRQGKFHRLFNALLPANHASHTTRAGAPEVPEHHEPLLPRMRDHIDSGTLRPNDLYSSGVKIVSGGLEMLTPGAIGSAQVSFSCTKRHGAALSLPVNARREDTLVLGHFRKWIIKHIDSWFAFAQELGLGILMEEIVLVTGFHRSRSWTSSVFNDVQTDAQLYLGVNVTDAVGAGVNWQVSNVRVQGAVQNYGPSGGNLPENQCLFIRGFRVKRFFGFVPWIKAAAEPKPDPRRDDYEPEDEAVPITGVSEYRDPLNVLLDYIAKRVPDCHLALVHDDDLERILGARDRSSLDTLNPDVVMDCIRRSKPEISVISDSLPSDDRISRTNAGQVKIAMLSEQLNCLELPASPPLLSQYQAPGDQYRSVSRSPIPGFETSIDDIVETVERFRILVVGRSGVGKSSLINRVFGIKDARVAHYKVGQSDIHQELVSPENQYFVLHDSKGFEPGDLSNFETVRDFVQQRSQGGLPLRDRIHGLWLCVETPPAGGRVFEQGDEYLLKFAHEIQVPIMIIFTQYDRLVRTKISELREDFPRMNQDTLRDQSREKASIAYATCLRSLERTMRRLGIPMPQCANVSIRLDYEHTVGKLVEVTRDVVRDHIRGDAWIMWAIAQRASPSVKIDACVTKGMNYYKHAFSGSMLASRRLSLREYLEKVRRDIVTCWNFEGDILNSKEFDLLLLRLLQDVQFEPDSYSSNIDIISRFTALRVDTPASRPVEPLESTLGLSPDFMQLCSTPVAENTSWTQRFMITYAVDLLSVLGKLFDNSLKPNPLFTATWEGLQGAYEAYERSGSRRFRHNNINSKMAQCGPTLHAGGMNEMVRVVLAA